LPDAVLSRDDKIPSDTDRAVRQEGGVPNRSLAQHRVCLRCSRGAVPRRTRHPKPRAVRQPFDCAQGKPLNLMPLLPCLLLVLSAAEASVVEVKSGVLEWQDN